MNIFKHKGVIFLRLPNLVLSTIILFVSNFIARILGFLYKVLLSTYLGETYLGMYHIVFNFLMICLAFTTTGIPTALSCLVAKRKAIKDNHYSNVLFISTLYIAFFISMTMSLVVSLNSKFISSKILHNSDFSLLILAICPAIVIVTISNVIRGYYYGIKKVKTPAISQIIEQVSRIILVLSIILYINDRFLNCYVALLGVSLGEIASILYMLIFLYKKPYFSNKYTINIKEFYNSSLETLKISFPITCNRMSNIFLHSISSIIVPSRLVLAGFTYYKALSIYGIISGMVMPFIYLPFTVGSALVVNLIPSISQEMALNNYNNITKKINYSILLTLFVGIISSTFFYFYGNDLCLSIFKNQLAGYYLKSMCLIPLFLSLNQTLSSILHAINKEFIASVNTVVGMVIQLVCLYYLLPIPKLNIYAYIYTATAVSMLTCLLHALVLVKATKNFKH